MYNGVYGAVELLSPLKQKLFHTALSIARSRNEKLEFHQPVDYMLNLKYKIIDKIILSKIRYKLMGSNVEYLGKNLIF